jgi:beta-lactamase regulating signal transducer with metallopeptidase domain
VLYHRDYALPHIAAVVLLTWVGAFLLGMLARLPVRLILESSARSKAELARREANGLSKPRSVPKSPKGKKRPDQ